MTTAYRGNLTDDPKLYESEGKKPFTRLGLAFKTLRDDGTENPKPTYLTVKVFGASAVNAAASFKKGDPLVVIGKKPFEVEAVEDEAGIPKIDDEGNPVTRNVFTADDVLGSTRFNKIVLAASAVKHDQVASTTEFSEPDPLVPDAAQSEQLTY